MAGTIQGFGLGNDAPWRAGANENTLNQRSRIRAKFCGQAVAAGTYGLFYVINQDDTGEVILSTISSRGEAFSMMQEMTVAIEDSQYEAEQPDGNGLTYDFINLTKNTARLVLNWEKKNQFPVCDRICCGRHRDANATAELKGSTDSRRRIQQCSEICAGKYKTILKQH